MQQHQPQISPDYDADFYAWTQHQAMLLRNLGKVADVPADIDFDRLAEEIEDLGKAELRTVNSLIRQILVHLIKAASDPKAHAFAHWRTEATTLSIDLADAYARSMRRVIDMQSLWRKATKAADVTLQEHGATLSPDLPVECPYVLDDVLAEDFSFDAAVQRLREEQGKG
jgi:hypothetical protein